MAAALVIALIGLVGFIGFSWISGHSEARFIAKASRALIDLGLVVQRMPPDARKEFFVEGHALYEATKGKFHPRRFAMRFFGWYCAQNPLVDPRAFLHEGVLARSIVIMRSWARQEPDLAEAAEREVDLIFKFLCRGFESLAGQSDVAVMEAQLALLEMMKTTAPSRE